MSSNHVTELLKPKGEVVEQKPLLRGYISGFVGTARGKLITAPTAFPKVGAEENKAWVVTPEYSTVSPLGPCYWTAEHGTRLPAAGAKAVVSVDAEGVPTIVSWEGEQKESETKVGTETILQAHLAVAEKLPNGKIKIDTVDFDTASSWEATNKRFQPKTKGYYLIRANVGATEVLADGTLVSLWVMKNGSELTQPLGRTYWESGLAGNGQFGEVSAIVELNGSTDYAEIAGITAAGTNSPYKAVMQAFLIQVGPEGKEGKEGKAGVGKEYKAKAAGGLELGGAESNEFAIKALGITEAMIATEAIGSATIHKEAVTAEKIGSEAVTEEKIKTEAVTNAKIVAAAGIPESKLSLPEVVKKTSTQKVEGPFQFNPPGAPAGIVIRSEAISLKGQVKMIEAPLKLTFKEAGGTVASYAVQGEVTFEGAPEATNGMGQLFNNTIQFKNVGNIALGTITTLLAKPNFKPAEGSTTSAWGSVAVAHEPQLSKPAEGTATATVVVGLTQGAIVQANFTLAEHGAVHMKDSTSTGTVTEAYGLKVEDLKKAGTNYSVNSLGAAVKLKHAGPIEMTKGFGAWAKTPPVAQHAALPAPKTLLEVEAWAVEVDAVFKEYGMTA